MATANTDFADDDYADEDYYDHHGERDYDDDDYEYDGNYIIIVLDYCSESNNRFWSLALSSTLVDMLQ